MRALPLTRARAGLAVAVLVVASVALTGSTATAAPVSIELCAKPGTAALTASQSVPIWGFGEPSTPGDCSTASATLPGPVLDVEVLDTITLTIHNDLPAGPVQLEIPGISLAGDLVIAPGATGDVSFTASAAGTYLYGSGGDAGRQEAMGMYGALVVRPAAGEAYPGGTSTFDVESILVLSAVDPAFNASADPLNFDMTNYLATYWLINGTSYPSTPAIPAAAGQRLLIRYLNAGFDNTSMQLLGMYEHVVARDATLLNNPYDATTEILPAGGTEDVIATIPSGSPPGPNGYPLFNRNLHVTNGSPSGATGTSGGGMLTFVAAP